MNHKYLDLIALNPKNPHNANQGKMGHRMVPKVLQVHSLISLKTLDTFIK